MQILLWISFFFLAIAQGGLPMDCKMEFKIPKNDGLYQAEFILCVKTGKWRIYLHSCAADQCLALFLLVCRFYLYHIVCANLL